MTRTHRGKTIPIEVYHGIPKGWNAAEIIAEHSRLGGFYNISGPEATEPGAPAWLPDRKGWLQYRETLYRIADGVKAKDPACIELAIRYIELRYIGSYSGFIRSILCRRLKHVALDHKQKERLHHHFRALILNGEHTVEFRDYFKLWRMIITEEQKKEIIKDVKFRGEKSALWLSRNL